MSERKGCGLFIQLPEYWFNLVMNLDSGLNPCGVGLEQTAGAFLGIAGV